MTAEESTAPWNGGKEGKEEDEREAGAVARPTGNKKAKTDPALPNRLDSRWSSPALDGLSEMTYRGEEGKAGLRR
jgi:hypothetical protein